jgi:SAM-dependent methyltransferase
VTGVEFAEGSAATAQALYDVDVVIGDFLTAPISGQFDAVTMWHTLEHLPDPAAALRRSRELLRPGGRLVVSVPNSESLQARLGGDAWFLSALLARSGFEVERIGYLYPEMEGIGLIQTALNRAGLGQDTLYRFAKRDDTASGGIRLAASAAIATALAPVALAWSFVAPALRTGASMQAVARPTLR